MRNFLLTHMYAVCCMHLTKCLYMYVATSTLYGKHLRETTFMVFVILLNHECFTVNTRLGIHC